MRASVSTERPVMRQSLSLIAMAAAALVFVSHAALAQPAPGTCEFKKADIARDIDEAKAKNQTSRVRGLEKALRETQANCSDAKLQKAHHASILRQEKKVAERQRDLDQARSQGKADKIASREAKLAEEQAQLDKLRSGAR